MKFCKMMVWSLLWPAAGWAACKFAHQVFGGLKVYEIT